MFVSLLVQSRRLWRSEEFVVIALWDRLRGGFVYVTVRAVSDWFKQEYYEFGNLLSIIRTLAEDVFPVRVAGRLFLRPHLGRISFLSVLLVNGAGTFPV